MRKVNLLLLFCFLCGANGGAWGCNLQGGGKWWKGLSVAGVNIKVNYMRWSGTVAGNGVYDVSLFVTMNQGVKNYYSSTTGDSWFRENLPGGVLSDIQENCYEGNVVTATLQSVSVGGGMIVPTISGQHDVIGANSVQLLNNSPNLPVIAKVSTPPGDYMVGITPSYYSDTWTGKVIISASGISEGTYQVQIPVQISGVSVWFQEGSNYWDRINGQQVPPPVQTLQLPLSVRISGDGKPVDPTIHCDFNKSVVIDHGVLRKDIANGNSKIVPLQIQCNAMASARIKLAGNQSDADSVKVNLGRGISSTLSVSPDQLKWYKQMNQN
ncbi:TPA: hypothetical protein QHB62_001373 [Escherichia coli]|uniref:hypothetical protein n=1 Tax=Escherichia coli TaxID=562 RepID=UPI000BDF49ED|nr:hypothetical protein [Escherichia coli]EKK2709176.1 hypothetical protein [Escherichia coli O121]EFN9615937.1 hypothetical protein [Escherichia coli]UKR62964.1 hypothetical protein F1745_20900 [Escherichia coli]WJS34145.1 hypothetical protein QUR97_10520 [Escherichia coli]HDT6153841.1 hypothetical protein [Escherichia coli]